MRVTIPNSVNRPGTFIEAEVAYDVVATAGPPDEAPLGVVLTGFQFLECWEWDDEIPGGVMTYDTCEDYTDLDSGAVVSPYDDLIAEYIKDREVSIKATCREIELTTPENMV